MKDVPDLPGAEALAAWFGGWPSFHDAEIHELHLNRRGLSTLKLQTWSMTNAVDEKGFFVCEKYVLVTFSLAQIEQLVLEDFSHQNVIFELGLEPSEAGWVLTLNPCYVLSGIIQAKQITVAFEPTLTYLGPPA